ncbi:hypothetical protein ACRE_010470 [Hapsidospora chrysogenum ATCC 11550]|uniref:Yeast cell wall synthesis Kre9/Knh1-like N-terminal domain-containing protein n=1 Tax=Hapsidospora chrysogenum (strain ATCC 11550 / CBS 779.69 / DSM 880 / IAM 14645 / JCM 23072 / IMI 49137) TaxID=857340 RepID=A0A086TF82_HAPC1|nr:hypothetical protein ACRE_010470 [Hapsidospora chrysogenum ATCC 11550]
MRFFASASAVLAFAASAMAQTADFNPVYSPKDGEVVPAGSTFEVTWSAPAKYKDGTVSISLIGGADQSTLVPITDIASGIANSAETYQWAVNPDLGGEQLYGLVFRLESNPDIFQYSQPFTIKKSGSGNGGDKAKTSTVVTATGIKTVTLTSCPPEETTTTPSPIETTTPPVVTPTFTTTYHQNTTTTTHSTSKPLPPPTTSIVAPEPTVPAPAPQPEVPAPSPPESAGARLAAGPIALIGGLAMAYLAL